MTLTPRVYNTAVTVWTFLSQVLSADHGCVHAVTKLIACRAAKGDSIPSAQTGAYCIARDKLDEQAMHRLVVETGRSIENAAPDHDLWLGHRVVMVDGCTVTMSDTKENQDAFPQHGSQADGCGWPMMRCVVYFALATGVVLEAAMGRAKGKLTSEVSLFRETDEILEEDDVFLADRFFSGWFDLARLILRGVHVVVRKNASRKTDFRTGVRYGKDDHSVHWDKPQRPDWMTPEEYAAYPRFITLREIRIRVTTPGFRSREILVATDLLDDIEYSKDDLAALFRRRWQAELNLRSLKSVMQMDHLRCKKPHRVRNELRAHLLAYNLIRQVMCEAAAHGAVAPWRISFKGALQTCETLLPLLQAVGDAEWLCDLLFACCLKHAVGGRPNRNEPRVVKRRAKPYKLMTKPRYDYQPLERS
ncbi:IS4 family transposase [Lignipirellula cremea]|uniref:Transposase DDE domain protein n=1 Tax=Lignipirellula cremea TaxID=2528010 RepID=A0A518DRR3_9BACT|nr:IS4 family transposase [Lignipirellula cremea]QDU94513.1 Transposase DDE domain protein [Lignipirellula cremea]